MCHAAGVLEISAILRTRLLRAAVVVGGTVRLIQTAVDREVKAYLLVLPNHVRTIQQHIEHHILCNAAQSHALVCLDSPVAPLLALVLHPLLVVALAVTYIAVFVRIAKAVAVFQPAHRRLAVSVVGVLPAEHARIN